MTGAVLALALLIGQTPTFRSSADAVTIDLAVTQRSRWVDGLTREDFEVTDNGVAQTILDLSVDARPIDVTLMLEVGAGMAIHTPQELARGARATAAALRPDDRSRVFRFGSLVQRLATPDDLDVFLPPEGRYTALFDALIVAAAQPRQPGYRRLIVVVTDGVDTMSFLERETRAKVFDRSDAAIVLIAVRRWTRPHIFAPREEQRYDWILEDMVERTGGRLYALRPGEAYGPALRAAIEDFRKRYLLRFIPAGVAQTGWHDVRVRVTKRGKYDVEARRGYFRDPPER